MHTTSPTLLDQLRRPTAEAWARFVHLYGPLIYRWGRQAGLQESDAADLTQDVFVVLLRELPRFEYDPAQSFRAWLGTVTRNKWRDRVRRLGLPVAAGVDPDAVAGPDDPLGEHEYRRQLAARALDLVRPEFRPSTWRAFTRHVVEGAAAEEVAAELGLTAWAVYAAKRRVLARVREVLGDVVG